MNILILGANGFIGSHLAEAILTQTDYHIYAMDLKQHHLSKAIHHTRFHFTTGDITQAKDWVNSHIQQCDVIFPLVAIATPALYVQNPLRVFELDFEANLDIIRQCVKYQKHIIFPSTSEVYGMCSDMEFDEEKSHLIMGPIHKQRWIYSSSKQLLDRLIHAYGKQHGLAYTLFRPFNWYGPRLDDVNNPKPGGSRVLTQFIGNILRGENINLVNGGMQKRCFTFIDDGIDALLRIIEKKDKAAHNKIFNIGNPNENISIRYLAELLLDLIEKYYQEYETVIKRIQLISIQAKDYYGDGYQDISLRVPAIHRARKQLEWCPRIDLKTGLRQTLDFYLQNRIA